MRMYVAHLDSRPRVCRRRQAPPPPWPPRPWRVESFGWPEPKLLGMCLAVCGCPIRHSSFRRSAMNKIAHHAAIAMAASIGVASLATSIGILAADPLPPDTTYRPLPTLPFSAVKMNDEAQKEKVMQRQFALLSERYD